MPIFSRPIFSRTSIAYAFRKMGPDEMVLWEKRRRRPVRFVGNFMIIAMAIAVTASLVMAAVEPGLSKGIGEYFAFAMLGAVCLSVFLGAIALITAVIFYSSGVSKYKQAWEAGVRPTGWEEPAEGEG